MAYLMVVVSVVVLIIVVVVVVVFVVVFEATTKKKEQVRRRPCCFFLSAAHAMTYNIITRWCTERPCNCEPTISLSLPSRFIWRCYSLRPRQRAGSSGGTDWKHAAANDAALSAFSMRITSHQSRLLRFNRPVVRLLSIIRRLTPFTGETSKEQQQIGFFLPFSCSWFLSTWLASFRVLLAFNCMAPSQTELQ